MYEENMLSGLLSSYPSCYAAAAAALSRGLIRFESPRPGITLDSLNGNYYPNEPNASGCLEKRHVEGEKKMHRQNWMSPPQKPEQQLHRVPFSVRCGRHLFLVRLIVIVTGFALAPFFLTGSVRAQGADGFQFLSNSPQYRGVIVFMTGHTGIPNGGDDFFLIGNDELAPYHELSLIHI